jgi:hypothetical protein
MIGKLAVVLGYAKAPRATFLVRHPKAGVVTLAATQALRESRTVRRVAGALVGLGAASVAIPALAVWMLRR